jgi:cation transport ATPase
VLPEGASAEEILTCPQGSQLVLSSSGARKMVQGRFAPTPEESAREQQEAERQRAAQAAAEARERQAAAAARQKQEQERARREQEQLAAQRAQAEKAAAAAAAAQQQQQQQQQERARLEQERLRKEQEAAGVSLSFSLALCLFAAVSCPHLLQHGLVVSRALYSGSVSALYIQAVYWGSSFGLIYIRALRETWAGDCGPPH